MSINDYLGELGEQKFQGESIIQIIENPVVRRICEKYECWLKEDKDRIGRDVGHGNEHDYCWDLVKDVFYTVKDVFDFSVMLKKYEKQKGFSFTGLFLSALINNSEKNDFKIITSHLYNKIDLVGFFNKKNLTVIGDVGQKAAWSMKGGEIVITGNTGTHTGMGMKAGKLMVEGSTDYSAGAGMQGGKLIINGSSGDYVGLISRGGEIYIYGEIKGMRANCKAKVYHKGVLVWPR